MKRIGLFPGSFDPFTKGHEEIIHKSLKIFDEIIIGIGINSSKQYLFDINKREAHIRHLFCNDNRVTVSVFTGLTVSFCKLIGASHIIRGVRDTKDFEYEKSIAHMNFDISGIETFFILSSKEHSALNSSIVRELFLNNADISNFVTSPNLLV